MEQFSIGKIYIDSDGLTTVDINPLPHNFCSFDCVFCPLGRTIVKTDEKFDIDGTVSFINKFKTFLELNDIDVVFINPDGEALASSNIIDIIKLIKSRGIKVRLLTNGYILNNKENKEAVELCDEIIGELAVTNERDFQKLQRPIEGYTLENYVENMMKFRKWYKGKFILDITIIKNYSDSDQHISKLKEMIKKIDPDGIYTGTPDDDRFKDAFKVNEERLKTVTEYLMKFHE